MVAARKRPHPAKLGVLVTEVLVLVTVGDNDLATITSGHFHAQLRVQPVDEGDMESVAICHRGGSGEKDYAVRGLIWRRRLLPRELSFEFP